MRRSRLVGANRGSFGGCALADAGELTVPELDRGVRSGEELVRELEVRELTLVNEALPFDVETPDWRLGLQHRHRLWAITLHYHAWVYELAKHSRSGAPTASLAAALLRTSLSSWLRDCHWTQPGVDALAWNSYAIATRLGWWVRLWHISPKDGWNSEVGLRDDFVESFHHQAAHLATNLEWDLRANHLLRDAVGLAWAGSFFVGAEANRWLGLATEIANSQADEQLLADGGHFERSPYYHLEVMDDWLTLGLLLRDSATRAKMRDCWTRAAAYARWLSHPNGQLVQFNDGAACDGESRLVHGSRFWGTADGARPCGGHWFKESGMVAWRGDPWSVFWDVGEVGPDYQPGHAHADTLTLEASFCEIPLFLDPGCYGYDRDRRRSYDRATSSHNTVCIDGENSSEVWHIFRVGRRARPRNVQVTFQEDGLHGSSSHTGYDHLAGRPRHTRSLTIADHATLQVGDRVDGGGTHSVEAGFLIDPRWTVRETAGAWTLHSGRTSLSVSVESEAKVFKYVTERVIHPDYGVEKTAQRLTWRVQGTLPVEVNVRVKPC